MYDAIVAELEAMLREIRMPEDEVIARWNKQVKRPFTMSHDTYWPAMVGTLEGRIMYLLTIIQSWRETHGK